MNKSVPRFYKWGVVQVNRWQNFSGVLFNKKQFSFLLRTKLNHNMEGNKSRVCITFTRVPMINWPSWTRNKWCSNLFRRVLMSWIKHGGLLRRKIEWSCAGNCFRFGGGRRFWEVGGFIYSISRCSLCAVFIAGIFYCQWIQMYFFFTFF